MSLFCVVFPSILPVLVSKERVYTRIRTTKERALVGIKKLRTFSLKKL